MPAYHLALVSLLVTSAMIARDQRISPDSPPTSPAATPSHWALGLLIVVLGLAVTLASDLLGTGLNALLLGVFVLETVPPRSALRRVF